MAEKTTITGSIGVFALKLSFGTLLRRLGVHVENVTLDKSASAMSIDRTWTDEESESIQRMIDGIYERFLAIVAESRDMKTTEVDKIAGGRVWSGVQAKKNGLVDAIGGLDDALRIARKKAELPEDCPVSHYPKPQPPFELFDLFGEEDTIRALIPNHILALWRASNLDLRVPINLLRGSLNPEGGAPPVFLLAPLHFSVN